MCWWWCIVIDWICVSEYVFVIGFCNVYGLMNIGDMLVIGDGVSSIFVMFSNIGVSWFNSVFYVFGSDCDVCLVS